MKLNTGAEFVNVDGNIVEADALRIAEAINDYDENLVVLCVDPARSNFNDAPFIIAEAKPDGTFDRIFECWELNQSVLERVEQADMTRYDIQAKIDRINAEVKGQWTKRYQERKEIWKDIVITGLKNRKSSFTYKDPNTGDLVTISDNKPMEKK
jgi:hypothetical protein